MSPQQFVDRLNMAEMPRLGYELIGGYWCWPLYGGGHHPEIYPATELERQRCEASLKHGTSER